MIETWGWGASGGRCASDDGGGGDGGNGSGGWGWDEANLGMSWGLGSG